MILTIDFYREDTSFCSLSIHAAFEGCGTGSLDLLVYVKWVGRSKITMFEFQRSNYLLARVAI